MSKTTREFADVGPILSPRSIAVIGASDQPGNLGGETVRRLLKFGFPGRVSPVGRSAGTVAGLHCFASVAEIETPPDLAIFALPAHALSNAIAECARIGTRHGIAYAGGLGEAGTVEGNELHRALVDTCAATQFVLCGPNCVGVIDATMPAASTFSTALLEIDALKAGGISMVCQSGGIATTAFSMVLNAGFGFRYLVSSGNEAIVDFSDYLNAFANDEHTSIIGGYLEGVADAHRFVRALAKARERGKAVVLIKAGTTGATARAAQAHTGALVGDDRVVDAIFEEMGVMRARSVEELVDLCCMLVGNTHRVPRGRGVGLITFGGGNGVLGADQCAQNGLSTPALSEACVQRLRPLLVSVATAANPLDLTPTTAFRDDAMAQLPAALDILIEQPGIDSLLFVVGSMAAKAPEICGVIQQLAKGSRAPVCVSWPSPPRAVPSTLAASGVYSFVDPARAIRALAQWAAHGEALRRPTTRPATPSMAFDWNAYVTAGDAQVVVPEPDCHRILAAAGLAVAQGTLVHDEDRAAQVAAAMATPVVLKGITPAVTHRAAAGLVIVDRRTGDEVRAAYRTLEARAKTLGLGLDGVLVQQMVPGGTELIVTAFRDAVFGVMVSVGSGGGMTEIIDDVRTARAPVSAQTAASMIDRLRTRSRAKDEQGSLDNIAAARFVARFSELAATAPWERFVFEVNPVSWRRDDAVALDGLLIVG